MIETPPSLPEPIQLERTKVEEVSRDNTESAQRFMVILIVFAILNAVILIAFWQLLPPGGMVFLALAEVMTAVFVLSFAAGRWRHAHRNQHQYATRTRITWTLRCRDVYHSWNVDGWGPGEGWRDLRIECMKLPKRPGKWLAVPRLRVFVDNGERALASKELGTGEDSRGMRVTDKFGKPLRILLSQSRPDEASLDEPWEVEISVLGDANPPDTPTATPLALDGPSTSQPTTRGGPPRYIAP